MAYRGGYAPDPRRRSSNAEEYYNSSAPARGALTSSSFSATASGQCIYQGAMQTPALGSSVLQHQSGSRPTSIPTQSIPQRPEIPFYMEPQISQNIPIQQRAYSQAPSHSTSTTALTDIYGGDAYMDPRGPQRSYYPSTSQLDEMATDVLMSSNKYPWDQDSPGSNASSEALGEPSKSRPTSKVSTRGGAHSKRRPSNRDEFDGPHQMLEKPSPEVFRALDRDLPHLPTNLDVQDQDTILCKVNDCLSHCAFNFVAKYQFPIPVESDKRPVRVPADREWNEWVYLLKRLATKRRIPARVLYNGQIKQLVTVLENSLEMRHAAKHQSRPLKDDRNVLQLISAGLQVTKILKDAAAMEYLDRLYIETEMLIQRQKTLRGI
ncbi:MAG: hypothetical protein M1834_003674 [Cirrosporium novae-zelandiae]|nr:MAG: hypothetical protein M1834_003674 [Cirrosporium novae-zelandiae]